MAIFFTKKFYCCFLVFATLFAEAQPVFTASATPSKAGKDEYITLVLTVANGPGVQQIQPPSLDNFTVVSGPLQETGMSAVNNSIRQYVSLSYILKPKKCGSFTFGPAVALISGKSFKSKPFTVVVSPRGTRSSAVRSFQQALAAPPGFGQFEEPRPREQRFDENVMRAGENVPEKISRNMQIRLETDRTSCFVGEPIVASYKLYSRLKSESTLAKNPSFNGFSVIDLTDPDPIAGHTNELLNGRDYNAYVIRKAQLYPLQAGDIALETATLDNRIDFLKYDNNDPYNARARAFTERVSLSSKPVTVRVKPLPAEGRPEDFKGAVGTFQIEAALAKTDFAANESGKLIITIAGKGNMQLLTAPEIVWPAGFESFEGKVTDHTDGKSIPVSGLKIFEIPFTVSRDGNYTTPEIKFSYFDPSTASYKRISAPSIPFAVSKAAEVNNAADIVPAVKKDESVLNSIFSHRWIIVLFVAGIIISGLIVSLSRDKKMQKPGVTATGKALQPGSESENPPFISDINPLAQTEECLLHRECAEFYAVLNREFRQYLGNRFSLEPGALTAKRLATEMDRRGIANDAIVNTQQLLQNIEWRLYTPFTNSEQLHEMYADAQTIIQHLNRHVG